MRWLILLSLLILLSCSPENMLQKDLENVETKQDVAELIANSKYLVRSAGGYGDIISFEIITDCVYEAIIVYTPTGEVKYKKYFKFNEISSIELVEYARNAIHN